MTPSEIKITYSGGLCPVCQSPMGMFCKACLAKQSHRAVLHVQPLWLKRAMSGELKMRLVKRTGREEEHVEMLYYGGHQSYCGIVFENPKKKKEWSGTLVAFSKVGERLHLCPECAAELHKAAQVAAMEAA